MNRSKLCVPDPQKWIHFFDKVSQGKVRFGQFGGARTAQILPLDIYTHKDSDEAIPSTQVVAPTEQTVEQAKSELERENINPTSVANMFQKTARRRRTRTTKRKKTQYRENLENKEKASNGRKEGQVEDKTAKKDEERYFPSLKKIHKKQRCLCLT